MLLSWMKGWVTIREGMSEQLSTTVSILSSVKQVLPDLDDLYLEHDQEHFVSKPDHHFSYPPSTLMDHLLQHLQHTVGF